MRADVTASKAAYPQALVVDVSQTDPETKYVSEVVAVDGKFYIALVTKNIEAAVIEDIKELPSDIVAKIRADYISAEALILARKQAQAIFDQAKKLKNPLSVLKNKSDDYEVGNYNAVTLQKLPQAPYIYQIVQLMLPVPAKGLSRLMNSSDEIPNGALFVYVASRTKPVAKISDSAKKSLDQEYRWRSGTATSQIVEAWLNENSFIYQNN